MIRFTKMHGVGNDFVIIDNRKEVVIMNESLAARIANRQTGIGCDQLVLLENSKKADIAMRIYNADGGEVPTCGNAARCVAWIAMEESGKALAKIETGAGVLDTSRAGQHQATVDMGAPRWEWNDVPIAITGDTLQLDLGVNDQLGKATALSMGNPHAVFFVTQLQAFPVAAFGPSLENHALFPMRANIGFAQVDARDHISLRVWERGSGETLACGTGACAALVAAHRRGLTERNATISLKGGELKIHWLPDDENGTGHVLMTGPVAESFRGTFELKHYLS